MTTTDPTDIAPNRRAAPATRAERRDAAMSFGNIESAVYEALQVQLQATYPDGTPVSPWFDVWVADLGPDWVVFECWETYPGPGAWKLGYTLAADGTVTFDGAPVPMVSQTTWTPVAQANSARPAGETRADTATTTDCPTCAGTGKIREGNVTCPDCDGTGNAPAAAEKKSAAPSPRARPLVHQRRTLERDPEFRRVTAQFERRVEQTGNEIVLSGLPIVYDNAYQVRDMLGSFRETMKPGVAQAAMSARDFDCRFLINHDGMPLARSVSGTLLFEDTPRGLRCEPHLDARQQAATDLAVAIERGDVTQMSVGFMVADGGDEWRWGDDGTEEREVYQFEDLFDVSAVTYPASPTTSIELAQRMLATAGSETRERVRRLFAIGGAIRSSKPLTQKDGDDLRAAAEMLYRAESPATAFTVRLDAYRHAVELVAGALRDGKVLSTQNTADLTAALEALHSADDIDIPSITAQLETIDKALDAGQAGLAAVLGRANPDGDAADLNPTLVPATDPASDSDARARQRAKLEIVRMATAG
jgi:HK97 family phage prohead protease